MTRSGFDVSDPKGAVTGYDVAGGYIGGNTPHVWTAEQWAEQPARFRNYIWVYDGGTAAIAAAANAVSALEALHVPKPAIVTLDMETGVNPDWVNTFADKIHSEGWATMVYGSPGTVFRNPPRSGYWVADPTGHPHMYEHPHTRATQWTWTATDPEGQRVDVSLYDDSLLLHDTRPPVLPTRPPWAAATLTALDQAERSIQTAFNLVVTNTATH